MKKDKKKIMFIILTITALFIILFTSNSYGIIDYSKYKPAQSIGSSKIETYTGNIIGVIRIIAVIVGTICLTIIGIKYMIGSVEEKAEYKNKLVPFAVGVLIIVGGTVIVTFLYEIASGITA